MDAPDQTLRAAPDRLAPSPGRATDGFRPVALPALAAAVLVSAAATKAKAARAKAARMADRFEHEDAPQP